MFKGKKTLGVMACLLSAPIVTGALTTTTTSLLTNNQGLSSAVINLTAGSAAASGTQLTSGLTLGDGTVEEYVFTNASGGVTNILASSTTNISAFTFAPSTVNNSTQGTAEITLPDGTTTFTPSTTFGTAAPAADVSFSVDTSVYLSGTVYVVFGSFQDFAQVSATDGTNTLISGFLGVTDNDPRIDLTGTPFDFSGTTLAGTGTAIAAFDFDNTLATGTTLDFQQINTDVDGSRARFYGVIVDGVAIPIPEPSSTALLGIGALGLLMRRRR